MDPSTRAQDEFHIRVVVDRLVREGRSQRDIEAIVSGMTGAVPEARRSLPAMLRRLVSA